MKKVFVLLITCFMICLVGCANKPATDTLDSNPITEMDTAGITISNNQLAANFKLVCEQIGVNTNAITDMQKSESWTNGTSYTFTYGGAKWQAFFNSDATVEAIFIGDQIDIFNRSKGAYHVNDYMVDPNTQAKVELLAKDTLKTELGLDQEDQLSLPEWYCNKTNNLYDFFGVVVVTDENSAEKPTEFSICFEESDEAGALHLRYFKLGDTVLLDSFDEVKIPDRTPSVTQKSFDKTILSLTP
ncbi:MAG: hypothetical protein IKC24_06585 [Oscillospiraceae bacterium]|nr:hypothetical protein [Oscillospiraceae bacterium]